MDPAKEPIEEEPEVMDEPLDDGDSDAENPEFEDQPDNQNY